MAIRDHLLDLEQRLKRLAGEGPAREPLEIRQAVLQHLVDATQPTGRGRRVLPFDRVDVDVVAETAEARRVIEAVFARDEGLQASARRALEAAGCTPGALVVEVHFRKKALPGWAAGQRYAVSGRAVPAAPLATTEAATVADGAPAVTAVAAVCLRVVKGRAARRTVELHAERINIGRGEEVRDRDQRLVRRNHLAFVPGDEASESVSRAHAHIRRSPTGECRLRDDNSAHGTRIVRGGHTIEVLPGHSRGVKLQPGDDLHFGRAVVRFEVARDE